MNNKIIQGMKDAEDKAWEALSGYKFWMFGYHAARWVNYARLLDEKYPNPFNSLVKVARNKVDNYNQEDLLKRNS